MSQRKLNGEAESFSIALNDTLSAKLTPQDLELRFRAVGDRGYVSAETDRMILSDAIAEGIESAASHLGLEAAPTVVYLSNEIFAEDRETNDERYSMYSILAGIDFSAAKPLGGSRLESGDPIPELAENEILLSRWLAEDLEVDGRRQGRDALARRGQPRRTPGNSFYVRGGGDSGRGRRCDG